MNPHHIVYVSRLAPGQDPKVLFDICRHAPQANAERGISGVLLFDGHRFCQWLAGPAPAVRALTATILLDPRHVEMGLCLESNLPPDIMPPDGWWAGTVDVSALDIFEADRDTADTRVIDRFRRLLAGATALRRGA